MKKYTVNAEGQIVNKKGEAIGSLDTIVGNYLQIEKIANGSYNMNRAFDRYEKILKVLHPAKFRL